MERTLFGAVRELDNNSVTIPAEVEEWLADEARILATKPNTCKTSVDVASVGMTAHDAETLRAQVKQFAKNHNLAVSLPDSTKFEQGLNMGTRVTFRLAPRKPKTQSGPVTSTRRQPAAA